MSTLDPYPKVLTANAWVKRGRNLGAYRAIVKQEEEAGRSSMAATGHKASSPPLLRRMPKKVTQYSCMGPHQGFIYRMFCLVLCTGSYTTTLGLMAAKLHEMHRLELHTLEGVI